MSVLDEDTLTWRRAAIIGLTFLTAIILAGIALVVFREVFRAIGV